MGVFDSLIAAAQQAGIFAFYLPFLITFALLYGLLRRVKIFGDDKPAQMISVLISFAAALFVIAFTPVGITVSKFFATFFSQATMTIITIIVGIIVLALVGETIGPPVIAQTERGPVEIGRRFVFGKWAALVIVLVVIGVFINSGGLQALGLAGPGVAIIPGLSAQDIVILAFIILTVILVYWVSEGGKKGG